MDKEASPRTVFLHDYQAPAYWIDTVDLDFDLRDQGTRVVACLTLRRNPEVALPPEGLRLHGEQLNPIWLRMDGSELTAERYRIDAEGLLLRDPPAQFVLESEVEIAPENNTALEGLYRSGGIFCTQCEAEGFRKITWFLDRPDVMARFTTRIVADKVAYPVLLSNGNPRETGQLDQGRHYAVWDDPFPKPAYLFALVAGDLRYIQDTFTTASGRTVDLRIYVEPENIDKCDHAMHAVRNAMCWDEEKYGCEYDLDVYNIVAVNDFNMGAMENKGLNVFNSKFVLARADTATDIDFLGIESVIAHEYFHNWTGNRITCRDWFQLSLKEGFTVYRDQEFSSDMGARGVKRIEDVRRLRSNQFAEDAGPMAHPIRPASYIEINNFYTTTVYEKGAEVVRMQANLLGPDLFRQATDLYFARHDGQAVTTDDFVACMAAVSGRDFTQFKHWYDYAGTPLLRVRGEYAAQAGTYTLEIEQHVPDTPGQSDKPPFHIPVAVGLIGPDGSDLSARVQGVEEVAVVGTHLLEVTAPRQKFVFQGVGSRPVPSLLRGFSAPVRVEFDYPDEELMFLMAHDSDGFSRWDAAQGLMSRVLLGMVAARQIGEAMQVPQGLLDAMRSALLSETAPPALIAEVLSLPSIGYLGDQMREVDVDGLFLAREQLRRSVAEQLGEDLCMVYEQLRERGSYAVTPEAIGRRSLKNLVLGYLMAGDDDDALQLCLTQYGDGHNMTDVMAAMTLLTDGDYAERDEVLADFAKRWADDPLVMDKWFTVQATATRAGVLDEVKALMTHPAFSLRNPNKVRAVIGAFATANPVRFHAADGGGYDFLAANVLALDPLNPQVAARLLRAMARWRRYDAGRQAHMRAAFERILAAQVSRDVYEIASKSIEG